MEYYSMYLSLLLLVCAVLATIDPMFIVVTSTVYVLTYVIATVLLVLEYLCSSLVHAGSLYATE